ncbi:hypothetical protein ACC711_39585, partial [Rhizobium ruizarguesonis]
TEFDYGTLEHRLRELAFLNSVVRILLTDKRHSDINQEELRYDGGLEAFVARNLQWSIGQAMGEAHFMDLVVTADLQL